MARRLPEVLTRDEARALLATPNRYYPTGQRDLCLMKLMLNSGLRSSEVLNLTWRDVDLQTGRLTVRHGKGDKDRQVWVNESTLELMRAWRERSPESRYWASLPVGGGLELEQCLERSIDPRQPQMQQMIEALFAPAHPHPFETLLNEPFTRTFDVSTIKQPSRHFFSHLRDIIDLLSQKLNRDQTG